MSEATPETARTRLSGRVDRSEGPEVGNVDDFTIPGPDGSHYDGVIHGFFGMLGLSASADCIKAVSGDLRETMVHDE